MVSHLTILPTVHNFPHFLVSKCGFETEDMAIFLSISHIAKKAACQLKIQLLLSPYKIESHTDPQTNDLSFDEL